MDAKIHALFRQRPVGAAKLQNRGVRRAFTVNSGTKCPGGTVPCANGEACRIYAAQMGRFRNESGQCPPKNGRRLHKIRKNGVGGLYFAVGILYTKTNTVLTPIRKVRLYDYH